MEKWTEAKRSKIHANHSVEEKLREGIPQNPQFICEKLRFHEKTIVPVK
jgi:hypothetical protein